LVADLKATLPKARILVTSRIYAYRQPWQLVIFSAALLDPFWSQIRRFIERWYAYSAGVRGWSDARVVQEQEAVRLLIAWT
jgi:hypothetical protein